MKKYLPIWITCLALTASFGLAAWPARAQQRPERLLMPIGGGYSDIYAGFAAEAVARATNNNVTILVLPIAYATDPFTISDAERQDNLVAAEERRFQIEETCQRAAPPGVICSAVLAPILTRPDAENPEALKYIRPDLSAVFILGGDQTIAMQVIGNTPFEAALADAYNRGALVAGTSAGGAVQSSTMLGGYSLNFADATSLNFGAADVWLPPARHGLPFGIPNAILDQHFYQRGRLGRLLNAISLPEAPHLGIGIDAYTGVHAPEGARLENVFGLYTVTILDAQTYHAADAVRYSGPQHTLSLRNVLLHLLSPGQTSFDLQTRQHSLAAPSETVVRTFDALRLPSGAGPLILTGGLSETLDGNPVLNRFANLSGGKNANIIVIAAGFPSDASAQRSADKYKVALGVPAQTLIVSTEASLPVALPSNITGILLVGRDQSKIQTELLQPVRDAWLAGTPLLLDDAGAAIAGQFYAAHPPTPNDAEQAEAATQKSFLLNRTEIKPGLGLLLANLEPRLLNDNRWGRMFSLAYNYPDLLALGLSESGGIEINPSGAVAVGAAPNLTLDLRQATLALGDNEAFVIANGLLDIFAPGDPIQPVTADQNAAPVRLATPVLATQAPPATTPSVPTLVPSPTATVPSTLVATRTPRFAPSRTPRPTPVPPVVPPASSPGLLRLMTVFAAFAALVVFFGIWINRKSDNSR